MGDALEPDGRRSDGQNHPGDHESDAAEGLFAGQTTKRPKTTGSQEDRQDVCLIASKKPAIGRGAVRSHSRIHVPFQRGRAIAEGHQ